jgi:Mg-chelatase subunit ChlD
MIERRWAFWRRVIYGTGFSVMLALIGTGLYFMYGYQAPNCLDGFMNGVERGIDCGGGCARICTMDVSQPYVKWVKSFRVSEGLYNAVAYLENRNVNAGVSNLSYTLKLYDEDGLITERKGETPFPPNTLYPIFEGRISTGERIPTETVIEFDPDSIWVEAVLNGDQYKTERRELTGADRKPVLTATLKNETLDESRDVDIVATIFDAQGTPLTASRTKIPSFPGRASKDVTFTWPEPIATTMRSCEVPTDVVLAIDLSGSMNDDGGTPPQPISAVLEAARTFALRLNERDQVGLVTYATVARTVSPLTKDRAGVGSMIDNLRIEPADERGSTNTGDAIIRAHEELRSVRHNADARTVLILLTDGLATAPGESPEDHARNAVLPLKESGVEVFTIGLGEKLNEAFLTELASDSSHYFKAPSITTLGGIYETITGAICEEGAAVIDIIAKPTATYSVIQ